MKHLLVKDFKLIINIKRIAVSIIVFILIFLAFTFMFKDFMSEQRLLDQVNVGIIDEEQSFLSNMLLDNFKKNEAFSGLFSLEVGDENSLLQKYHNNELSALVYIPSTFTDSLYRFENTPLKMILNPNYPLKNTVLENIMGSYSTFIKSVDVGIYSLYNTLKDEGMDRDELRDVNERFSVKMVFNALGRNEMFDYIPLETYPSSSAVHYFGYSIMILIIIFTASSGSNLFNHEIEHNCLNRYHATGESLIPFSLSKSMVMSLNIMLILTPLMIVIKLINKDLLFSSYLMICLLMLVTVLFFVSLSLTLGIILYKYNVNALFSTMVTLILGIIGGQFIPIQIMPKFIQNISSFTPNYWILKVSLHLNQNIISKEVWYTLGLLLLVSFIFSLIQNKLIKRSRLWVK
jgi:ABC-2 type transport system permease protein